MPRGPDAWKIARAIKTTTYGCIFFFLLSHDKHTKYPRCPRNVAAVCKFIRYDLRIFFMTSAFYSPFSIHWLAHAGNVTTACVKIFWGYCEFARAAQNPKELTYSYGVYKWHCSLEICQYDGLLSFIRYHAPTAGISCSKRARIVHRESS